MVAYDQNGSRNDAWLCLRMLEKFKRQLKKFRFQVWLSWIFPKKLTLAFESKLKNFSIFVYDQNGLRNDL